jgi:hypothetical protein
MKQRKYLPKRDSSDSSCESESREKVNVLDFKTPVYCATPGNVAVVAHPPPAYYSSGEEEELVSYNDGTYSVLCGDATPKPRKAVKKPISSSSSSSEKGKEDKRSIRWVKCPNCGGRRCKGRPTDKKSKKGPRTSDSPLEESNYPSSLGSAVTMSSMSSYEPSSLSLGPSSTKEKKNTSKGVYHVAIGPKCGHPCQSRIPGPRAFYINGKVAPVLHLRRGRTYLFRLEQPESLSPYRLHFTTDCVGTSLQRHPSFPDPISNGTVCLTITDSTPSLFYYQDTDTPFMGGTVILDR